MAKEEKKHQFTLGIIKKGTDVDNKVWIEMATVNDIFKQALLLNKKDRKKMFKEFAKMNEVSVLYKKSADEMIKGDSKIEVQNFMWCND